MPSTLELYGTSCCHLCEEAQAILRDAGIVAQDIDIADDGGLLERYGVRIPVLRRTDNGAELGWPFDAVAVVQFQAGIRTHAGGVSKRLKNNST